MHRPRCGSGPGYPGDPLRRRGAGDARARLAEERRHPSFGVASRGRRSPVPTKQAGPSRLRHGPSQPVRAPLGAVPPEEVPRPSPARATTGSAPFTRGAPSLRGPALRRGVSRSGGTTPSRGEGDPCRRARGIASRRAGPRGPGYPGSPRPIDASAPGRLHRGVLDCAAAEARRRRCPRAPGRRTASPVDRARRSPVPTKQAGPSRLRHGPSQPVRVPLGAVPPEEVPRPSPARAPTGSAPLTIGTPSLRGPALRRGVSRSGGTMPSRGEGDPCRRARGIASRRAGPRSAGNARSP